MSESQKETFRKYLEQAGAIDVLVKGEPLVASIAVSAGAARLHAVWGWQRPYGARTIEAAGAGRSCTVFLLLSKFSPRH